MVMIARFFGMQSIGSAWIEQRFWEFYTRENEDDLKDFHFDTKVLLKYCADTTTISWPCWSYERMVKKWVIWWLGTICIFMKLWQVWLNWFQNRYVFQVYDCAVPMRQVPFRNRWSFHPVDQLNFEVCYRTYEGLFCRILGIGCLFRFTQLEGVPRAWIIRNHVTFGTPEFPWDSFRFIWMIGTFGTSFNYDFENIKRLAIAGKSCQFQCMWHSTRLGPISSGEVAVAFCDPRYMLMLYDTCIMMCCTHIISESQLPAARIRTVDCQSCNCFTFSREPTFGLYFRLEKDGVFLVSFRINLLICYTIL